MIKQIYGVNVSVVLNGLKIFAIDILMRMVPSRLSFITSKKERSCAAPFAKLLRPLDLDKGYVDMFHNNG